jgi:hypothetical protein
MAQRWRNGCGFIWPKEMDMDPEVYNALLPALSLFDELGILYYIGGSVASSAFGISRLTIDADVVAVIHDRHIPVMVDRLRSQYYIDENMIITALRQRASFNIIHLHSMIKLDIFAPKEREYDRMAFQRRSKKKMGEKDEQAFYLASPEDVVLSKLEWYKLGAEQSERQWGDILGIMKIQKEKLDIAYITEWAQELGLTALWIRAQQELAALLAQLE